MRGLLSEGFDPLRPHRLSPRVGLRPEPFGALAYHFDNRRLVFLKSPELVALVRSLEDHPSAAGAVEAAVETAAATTPDRVERSRRSYLRALASLADAEVICER